MGGGNSTTKDKQPDPLHPNNQLPVASDRKNYSAVIKSATLSLQESIPPSSARHPSSNSHVKQTTPMNKEHSSHLPSRKPITTVPITNQSFNILGQNPPSSAVEKQRMPSNSYDTTTNNTITSNSLEKAPMIKLNYVAKSPDDHLLHTYRPDHITVNHRTSSQSTPNGNRWYDHDFNKNEKPLINKYL